MRAVLDPNVIISAALSPRGSPARALRLWVEGAYDLIVSPLLLDELGRVLARPKLQQHISQDEAEELLRLLHTGAVMLDYPDERGPIQSRDRDDNYLIALASESRSVLVSGDRDLLELSEQIPVYSPAEFLTLIGEEPTNAN